MIKIFYDVETTGINYKLCSIHELAMIIEVDGKIDDVFRFNMQPHPKALIEQSALNVCGVSLEQIQGYPAL